MILKSQLITSCKEMFPELADENNKERFIDFLTQEDFKTFTRAALKKANYELTDKDLQLCEIICDTMIRKNVLHPYERQTSIDVIIMAAMLRNTYKDKNYPITSLFKPREEFNEIELNDEYEHGIPKQFFEQLYQLIEGQDGDLTEVQFCKPSVGSIQELFAECIYIQECIERYGN